MVREVSIAEICEYRWSVSYTGNVYGFEREVINIWYLWVSLTLEIQLICKFTFMQAGVKSKMSIFKMFFALIAGTWIAKNKKFFYNNRNS